VGSDNTSTYHNNVVDCRSGAYWSVSTIWMHGRMLRVTCCCKSNGGNEISGGITHGCRTSPRNSMEPRMGENNNNCDEIGPEYFLGKEHIVEWKLEGHTTREESLRRG